METVALPLLSGSQRIEAALDALQARERSAVVVDVGGSLRLALEEQLLAARSQGTFYLSEIAGLRALDALAPDADPSAVLDGTQLAARRSADDTAVVVSNDAVSIARLAESHPPPQGGASALCCTGPVTHFFPPPQVVVGDPCPLCVTAPGDRVPTIIPFS